MSQGLDRCDKASIRGVQLAIGDDANKPEHRVSPEEALRVAIGPSIINNA
jgi:hypothetical protein